MFGANGCGKNAGDGGPQRKDEKPYCGDKSINVNPSTGADPKAVYVCEGDVVTWAPNGHTFIVEFAKDFPFKGNPKKFTEKYNDNVSDKTLPHPKIKVYEYTIKVDGNPIADPQIIGGGHP
jgi:hypothetical protein